MQRKNHSESQLSIYAAEWQKVLKPAAKERREKTQGRPKKGKEKTGGNGAPIKKTRDEAAEKFGIGGRTVSKAANVLEKGCEQLQQAVKDGRINVSLAEKVAKKLDGAEQQEAVAVAMVDISRRFATMKSGPPEC